MSKPRFPVRVERTFVYRASIKETGEVLECESFKDLYNYSLSHLRGMVGQVRNNINLMYDNYSCVLEFGYSTEYWTDNNHAYAEWESLTRFGFLSVSSCSVCFLRFGDFKENRTERELV